ncbi:MAG: hypothetical protein ACYTAS_09180 [Planctomycetota bacterium]|jgi:hypothetical protein
MNQDNRDIDKLLKANVEGQLTDFDWDRFTRSVAGRLAPGDLRSRSGHPVARSLAVAAAILLAVGAVAVVLLNLKTPSSDTAPRAGRATVVIAGPAAEKGLGHCEVRIHSSAQPTPDDAAKHPRWCIVTRHESPAANGGDDRDWAGLACLF